MATYGEVSLDRMVQAVEKVRQRFRRATASLENAGISYAVVGGHAVAAWVSKIDEAAVRITPDVDILVRREDFMATKKALEDLGFHHAPAAGVESFLDNPNAKPRDAVHIIFSCEKVKPAHLLPAADVNESVRCADFQAIDLEPLVLMKDRVHVRDMIDVGLIDSTWPARFPAVLGARLQELLDTPDG